MGEGANFAIVQDMTALHRLLNLVLLCGLTGSLMGQLHSLGWWFDLMHQFQLHALLAGLACLPLALLLRKRDSVYMSALLALSGFVAIAPALTLPSAHVAADGQQVKVLYYNVLSINRDQPAVEKLVREEAADVVVLLEGNYRWQETIDRLRDAYPHQHMLDDEGNFGSILLSRYPFDIVAAEKPQLADGFVDYSMVIADIKLLQTSLRLIAKHASPPVSPERAQMRNRALSVLASIIMAPSQPVVLVGDFNATPWTRAYRQMVKQADLSGTSWIPSWPAPMGLMGISIDQVLAGNGAVVSRVRTGPRQGSDHLARIATISLPATP